MINPFNIILVNPLINILVAIYHFLVFVHIPFALGFSVILLTVLIRVLISPIFASQQRVTKKMQELAPHVSKIKEKHKGDMKKQQEATMALYKEHNFNPAAGCLPSVIQIVILLFGLYPALLEVISTNPQQATSVINKIVYFPFLRLTGSWDTSFFGLPLGKNPSELFSVLGPIMILVPILTAALQLIQSKMMVPQEDKTLVKDKKKQDDFASTFQKQSLYLIPLVVGYASFKFSLGLSLYWNTFTLLGIIQQYKMSGLGGLASWISLIKKGKKNG